MLGDPGSVGIQDSAGSAFQQIMFVFVLIDKKQKPIWEV